MSVTISNLPKRPRASRAFFLSAKNAVLGQGYALSVAFVSGKEMRRLNRLYRGKDTSTDILSFPLSKKEGDIVFSMKDVSAQAPRFSRTAPNFLSFLFIHGLCHLKGMKHGSRMEREEIKFRKKFGI